MSENLTKFFKTILLYQNIADTLIYSNINFKDLCSLRIKLFRWSNILLPTFFIARFKICDKVLNKKDI